MNQLLLIASVVVALGLVVALRSRLRLSRAKHPSLRGHPRLAKRVARLLPGYRFDETDFFVSDGADRALGERRARAFRELGDYFRRRNPESMRLLRTLADGVSDLQFTGRYRVPFQYADVVRNTLYPGVLVESSSGPRITDIDGNEFLDLTGAYGVNVLGNEFYKSCMDAGARRVAGLGPVLGPYHSVVADNVARLKRISGHDEVSFHMSGTEAVMQAVRLARYHTGRSHIVRFCGAYHGWWDDVQPGIGNPGRPGRVYTLAEQREATLHVLRTRRDIACVLVNPLQAMHPNGNAPGDGSLVAADRHAAPDPAGYAEWLAAVREACDQNGVVLIFDEVFVGFRIAPGGAQEYFGVRADLVTYGKTLGGGLPVGAVCGTAHLMKRYREDRPADICFARGTFNSHPYVMAAMNEFLVRLDSLEMRRVYEGLDARWQSRAEALNTRLRDAQLPVQVAHFSSIFTVIYERPSRYNWMFQFYLNAQGLLLPWVGSGRLIFSLDYDDDLFAEFADRFVAAAKAMEEGGWWQTPPGLTNRAIKRMILRETVASRLPWRLGTPSAPAPAR